VGGLVEGDGEDEEVDEGEGEPGPRDRAEVALAKQEEHRGEHGDGDQGAGGGDQELGVDAADDGFDVVEGMFVGLTCVVRFGGFRVAAVEDGVFRGEEDEGGEDGEGEGAGGGPLEDFLEAREVDALVEEGEEGLETDAT
jgi:hypothetical protein